MNKSIGLNNIYGYLFLGLGKMKALIELSKTLQVYCTYCWLHISTIQW